MGIIIYMEPLAGIETILIDAIPNALYCLYAVGILS